MKEPSTKLSKWKYEDFTERRLEINRRDKKTIVHPPMLKLNGYPLALIESFIEHFLNRTYQSRPLIVDTVDTIAKKSIFTCHSVYWIKFTTYGT